MAEHAPVGGMHLPELAPLDRQVNALLRLRLAVCFDDTIPPERRVPSSRSFLSAARAAAPLGASTRFME